MTFLSLFKSVVSKENTVALSETEVTNELNLLLNDLTIESQKDEESSDAFVSDERVSEVSERERLIEENQILYAQLMNERMLRIKRKLI
ncbi:MULTISPECIES: hypothetical protein [unclassified Maribacter]|uniref:hypothetical protein n=1 Tax=unclassified Maribacter TaxID=2615042 RepID=UPI00257F87A6|nr:MULTISPECIES: hypothetical protein [unclassified Maribacter]|tara:strand:+ start:266 stop:532 length:267 start_codon:yes stop_codon:yes gene_type:complete